MKCKFCKEPFKPSRPLQQVCSPVCAIGLSKLNEEKKWKKERKELLPAVHAKEYKAKLQAAINRLARLIDAKFEYRCIDCDKPYGKQVDAGHYASVGSNSTLRFNLHNIHSQRAYCNQWNGGKRGEFYTGLIQRYGQEYADYIKFDLPLMHKQIHLSAQDVVDKLKLVNSLIKNFDTFMFQDGRDARNQLNNLIGIY